MDYLVSKDNSLELDGFKRVSRLKDVVTADSTSIVIINSFEEDSYKGSLHITDLYRKRGVFKFIYVSEHPSDNIRTIVESITGVVEEDESVLDDVDEIKDLVSLVEGNSLEVVESRLPEIDSGFEVLSDFITKFEQGDSKLNDPLYLEVVNRAVNDIRRQVEFDAERTDLMGRGVIETYTNTLELINELSKEAESMREQLAEIEYSSKAIKLGTVETLTYYPPITYAGSKPVAVFKEISSCRYLTSYVLGYVNHLQTVRSKRVRLVIVVGKQTNIRDKYKHMFELTKDNYKTAKAVLSTISYTTTPLSTILNYMTKQRDEIVIVLDRTYEKETIIKGRVYLYFGVSSISEIKRENLDRSRCIFPITVVPDVFVTVKHIKGFPTNVDSRLDVYERMYNESYNRLDTELKMDII